MISTITKLEQEKHATVLVNSRPTALNLTCQWTNLFSLMPISLRNPEIWLEYLLVNDRLHIFWLLVRPFSQNFFLPVMYGGLRDI